MSEPNVVKLIRYIGFFGCEPIEFEGKQVTDKIAHVKLNKTLFYTDNCLNCGGCDPQEANLFTQSEFKKIQKMSPEEFTDLGLDCKYLKILKAGLVEKSYKINQAQVQVYEYPIQPNKLYLPTREKLLDRCTWCFQSEDHKFKCRIHPVTSITCVMPHLRCYHRNGYHTTSVGIHQFGRNWALKCPVKLVPPDSAQQFELNKQNVIFKLNRIDQAAKDLNIQTVIPQLIEHIEVQEFTCFQEHTLDVIQNTHKLF